MSSRIVVAFRAAEQNRPPREYVRGARTLSEQAAAMGGRLIAWSEALLAFEFDLDALEDAVELAISVVLDSVPGHTFGVGISEGALERVEDATARVPLAWGPCLVRAAAFARSARIGEVLVDPALSAVRRAEVLTQGSRVGVRGKERIRGLILDIKHPWRSAVAESVAALQRPRFVGRPELGELLVSPGAMAVVRADRGAGGTRLLEELERVLGPACVLFVAPYPMGEPLGALRRALQRAVTAGHAPLAVDARLGASLDGLLGGEGLDPDSSAELVATWLTPDTPNDPSGVVILDDADEVDVDTLQAVAQAAQMTREPFRIVIRVGNGAPVPPALEGVRVAADVQLGPLAPADAIQLARACTRDELDERSAERWAQRGGAMPLDIVEAIHEALESGELVWEDGRAAGRFKGAGAGVPRGAQHWIRRRFDYLDLDSQRVLQGLAVLGGEAEAKDLEDVVSRRCGEGAVDVTASRSVLESRGWVTRFKPDLIALTSASERDALLATLSDEAFSRWNAAACDVFSDRGRPFAVASAAVHAALAGDLDRAMAAARRAASAAQAVGLEGVAEAFERLAVAGESDSLLERRLMRRPAELQRSRDASEPPPSSPDDEPVTPRPARGKPSEVPASLRPEAFSSLGDALVGIEMIDEHVVLSDDDIETIPESGVSADGHAGADKEDVEPVTQRGAELARRAERARQPRPDSDPPTSALAALKSGDAEAVERLARELRDAEGRAGLAERLEAMARLARGETGDALRRLRRAAEDAKRERSPDQCRALLALGVALAAAQRPEEALLMGLESLARARDRSDVRGEQACARFLAQLARSAGHADLAAKWQDLVV